MKETHKKNVYYFCNFEIFTQCITINKLFNQEVLLIIHNHIHLQNLSFLFINSILFLLQKNKISQEHEVMRKLNDIMLHKDPYYKQPPQTPDVQSTT